MEANVAPGLRLSTWRSSDNVTRRSSILFHKSSGENSWSNFRNTVSDIRCRKRWNVKRATVLKVSYSSQNFRASVLESERVPADDVDALLKNKCEDIIPLLEGRCIYLVGMMGSGKTTVGRIMSEPLKYSFFDCDKLIEQEVGGTTVTEIFQLYGESFFRDKETAVLKEVSSMQQLVVSTGGGAVLRPINWRYMHKGLSVWLDVPLEALARRIAAVGTESRPLLNGESGDAYTKAFKRLSTLLKDRGEAYANANARVSLEDMAVKYACDDICKLTPEMIAVEALVQIENFLRNQCTIS